MSMPAVPSPIEIRIVDELRVLKEQRTVLRQRLDRLNEASGAVPPEVLAKVRGDYERQQSALDEQARPLKSQAVAEHRKLASLLQQQRQVVAGIELEKAEISLRHLVGEFGDEELQSRLERIDDNLTREQAGQAELEALRELLLSVFDRPDEVEEGPSELLAGQPGPAEIAPSERAPAESVPVEMPAAEASAMPAHETPVDVPAPAEAVEEISAEPAADEAPAAEEPAGAEPELLAPDPDALDSSSPIVVLAETPPEPPVTPPEELPAAPETPTPRDARDPTEETMPTGLMPADIAAAAALAPPPPAPSVPPPLPPGFGDGEPTALMQALGGHGSSQIRTHLMQLAFLVPDPPIGKLKGPLPLEPLTSIGRTPQNQIQIEAGEISRQHAQIVLTNDGWLLRDLKSENGTFLNAVRVAEALLKEGDRVQLSTISFVFTLEARPPRT
jgi:hypothetical protein